MNLLKANYPNEVFHKNLTDLPKDFVKNYTEILNNNIKLSIILDDISKIEYVEIISNKVALNILPVLVKYINTLEITKLTDNANFFLRILKK